MSPCESAWTLSWKGIFPAWSLRKPHANEHYSLYFPVHLTELISFCARVLPSEVQKAESECFMWQSCFVCKIVKTYLAFSLCEDFVGKFSLLNTCFSWGILQSNIVFLVVLSTWPKPVVVLNLVEMWNFCTNMKIADRLPVLEKQKMCEFYWMNCR